MKQSAIARVVSVALILSTIASLPGCTTVSASADLMTGIEANAVSDDIDLSGDGSQAIADFAVKLFQGAVSEGDNPLVSPISVLCALAMTANGAGGETLAQMEDAFGLSMDELNECMFAYIESLPSGDKYKVNLANSIWFKNDDGLAVEREFLQTNADYYGASVYKAAFDNATLKDINAWVSDNTDGMVEGILDRIPEEAIMYLINALAFDAEWERIYSENQVREGTFTTESGETREVDMMYGTEAVYLRDKAGDTGVGTSRNPRATGFIKYYADSKYAFAALLPDEDITVVDYIETLTGERLMDILGNGEGTRVNTSIPKFESESSVEMSDILKSMGMTDAFDGNRADFSALGTSTRGNIFINRVIHKTYIEVDERGTKAGAATAVEAGVTSAPPTDVKTVNLDRPFVYMLIDCETRLPLLIGAVTDIGE